MVFGSPRFVCVENQYDGGTSMRAPGGRVESMADGKRARSLRGLQELRLRGVAVHHGVPVLRDPLAQAGAEARPRRPAEGAAAHAPAAGAAAARRDPRDPAPPGALIDALP